QRAWCLELVQQRLRFGGVAGNRRQPHRTGGNRWVVEIKSKGEIEAIRAAGQVVAETLDSVRAHAMPGTRLSELDELARAVLAGAGAGSPFLGYKPAFAPVPFPAVICASVNDAALHGIPGRRRLAPGDLVSIDCGAILDGWVADAAISFTVGPP